MQYQLMNVKVLSATDNSTYVGQPGEIVIVNDSLQLVRHDGSTAGGQSGGLLPPSTVAATGSVQTDAAALGTGVNLVTGADATKGVILPTGANGKFILVKNNTNAVLKVYPKTGGIINALSANAALSMAALTSAVFFTVDGLNWVTIPLLPS